MSKSYCESNNCKCGKNIDIPNGVPEDIKQYQDDIEAGVEMGEQKVEELNISYLRQWLNEDRITDCTKLVTNEEIKYWLNLGKPTTTELQDSKGVPKVKEEEIEKNKTYKKIESCLYIGLGTMNMLGVMEGKTGEGAIKVRDKVIKEILDNVKDLLTQRTAEIEKEIEGNKHTRISCDCCTMGCTYNQALEDVLVALRKFNK